MSSRLSHDEIVSSGWVEQKVSLSAAFMHPVYTHPDFKGVKGPGEITAIVRREELAEARGMAVALERAATIASTWHNTGLDENVRAADKACEEVARAIRAEIGDDDAS